MQTNLLLLNPSSAVVFVKLIKTLIKAGACRNTENAVQFIFSNQAIMEAFAEKVK